MGTGLYAFSLSEGGSAPELLCSGLPEEEGSFFPYRDKYYYKTRGRFIEISSSGGSLSAGAVSPYVPLVFINCDPASGSGTLSGQPNRLTGARRARYSLTGENSVFRLPEEKVHSLFYVKLNGQTLSPGSDYAFNASRGEVIFPSPPPAPEPFEANTLELCYSVPNEAEYEALMSCSLGAVVGPCIVLAGAVGSEEVYYWNGCHDAFDPGYFPSPQYNLCPFGSGKIRALLPWQDKLIIFSESSVSKAALKTASVGNLLSLDAAAVSSSVGCGQRGGAALAGGRVFFCDSSSGLYSLAYTSAAGENELKALSGRVNKGLLPLLKGKIRSLDDGRRLWLCVGGKTFAYDYGLDAWFYFEGIDTLGFLKNENELFSLSPSGGIIALKKGLHTDFGEPISRSLSLPAFRLPGSFFSVSGFGAELSPGSRAEIKYCFSGGVRNEPCPLNAEGFGLCPRNLKRRCLRPSCFPKSFLRQPRILKTAVFSAELSCREESAELGLVSAYFLYVPLDRLR